MKKILMTNEVIEEIKSFFKNNPNVSKYSNNAILKEIAECASMHWNDISEAVVNLTFEIEKLQKENEVLKEKASVWHESTKETPNDDEEVYIYTKDDTLLSARFHSYKSEWIVCIGNSKYRHELDYAIRWKRKI